MKEKIKFIREKYLPYNEKTIHRLVMATIIMFSWLLIWALVFKLGSEILLFRNYTNLKDMTLEERILWDIIPFNYRGTDYWKLRQFIDTILNCFVFAPLGVALCYVFKKQNVWRNALICFGFSLLVEMLQLFTTLGNPSTEDLITNVVGCFIGFGIYRLIFQRLSVKQNVKFWAAANVLLVACTIFSLITTIIAAELIFGIITKPL